MVSDFREGQCQPLSSGPLTRHDVNAQSHIPHKPPHKTHNSLSSLYPSPPPLAVTAYLVATSRSWKVRTLKKPSHYSICIAINYACMHALSYAHHSPIIVLFSLWCQEKRKKEKGRSFEERKMPFSPVFELSHNLSLETLLLFSKLINHKAIDYKIISSPLTSYLLFCSAKKVLYPSAPSHLLLSLRGMGHLGLPHPHVPLLPSLFCSLSLSFSYVNFKGVQPCSACQWIEI